jgi:predicted TIM-barrel fold metal-dependent hydrolase
MVFSRRTLLGLVLVATISRGKAVAGEGDKLSIESATSESEKDGNSAENRNQIVPLVAAHQHLLGPESVPQPEPPLPEVKLPPDLQLLLDERARLSGSTEPTNLFVENAIVLKSDEATWARGRSDIQLYTSSMDKGLLFVPNAYGISSKTAYIAGGIRKFGAKRDDFNFLLALQKDTTDRWQIAAETDTTILPREFTKPVTADQLVQELDDAGIQEGVVLSIAYWFGSALQKPVDDEYAKVRAENDWTAAQVARYPNRLVFFCGVNPLKGYALAELDRCSKMPQMKGIKLHLANSGVDVRDPKQLEKLQTFFKAANEHKLAIVVHVRSLRGDYGRPDAEIFIRDVLPSAPDIPIQLAHLAGSGPGYGPDEAMATYAEAIASGDQRTRNLYFDVTNCVTLKNDQPKEELDLIAKRLRQVGLRRVFFGSDMSTDTNPPPGVWWAAFRKKIPMTDEELRVIARNVPPYMH